MLTELYKIRYLLGIQLEWEAICFDKFYHQQADTYITDDFTFFCSLNTKNIFKIIKTGNYWHNYWKCVSHNILNEITKINKLFLKFVEETKQN